MTTTADTFITFAREIRNSTLAVLERAEEPWLLWTPPGMGNHLIWHAGHCLWVADVLIVELLNGKSELPAGWMERFGMDSKPKLDQAPWPSRAEIAALLKQQLPRLEDLLRNADPKLLEDQRHPRTGEQGTGWSIVHALHDEARHTGEMYLLLKLCRTGKATQKSHVSAACARDDTGR